MADDVAYRERQQSCNVRGMKRRSGYNPKRRIEPVDALTADERAKLSMRAAYGGNPEHKRSPSDYGLIPPVAPRPGKTLCDGTRNISKEEATDLLRGGLLKGMFSRASPEEWPQNVWSVSARAEVFEAQLENATLGTYHGYPMPEDDEFRDIVASGMGAAMIIDLEFRADWEKLDRGTPEERACFAAIGIRYQNIWLTEAEDAFLNRVRTQVHVSGYRLAEWLAWNWWRLRWEPRTRAADWALAHHMSTIGGGYVWPNLVIFSDGERIVLLAKPARSRPTEPLRYIADIPAVVLAGVFENAADRFIEQVLGQLREERLPASNLARIWQEVRAERADENLAKRRKLEALLGFDPDEGDDAVIEALVKDAGSMGQQAMDEVAADRATQGGAVVTAVKLQETAQARGFDSAPRDAVRLTAGEPLPPKGTVPAWRRGAFAAQAVRYQENLGATLIDNAMLAQLAAVDVRALTPDRTSSSVFSFALDNSPARGWVVLRSKWETGRRFELARIIGDRVAGGSVDRLLPATHSYTYRQKYQRAFAAEFLCPFDALEHFLHDDYSGEAIQDAANHFNVSPLTVRTLLVNHGRVAREDLDEDMDTAAA